MRRIQLVLAVAVAIAAILGSIGVASAQDGTTTQTAGSDVSANAEFKLTEVRPDGDATGVNRGITIRAGFNQNLDKNTVNKNTFRLLDQTNDGKEVDAKRSVDNSPNSTEDNSTTSFAYLNPKDNLKSGHTYKVIVEGGDNGVLSKSGKKLKDADSSEGVIFDHDRAVWFFTVE